MRLKAQVTVSNRMLCQHNMKKPAKPVQASIAIGRKPKHLIKEDQISKDPEVFVLVCTAQNRAGTKYAVRGSGTGTGNEPGTGSNIDKVFAKFVEEGKATVRFKSPPHDLCLSKADVVQLKAFLGLLRKITELKAGDQEGLDKLVELNCSALNPASASQVTKDKTKMIITSKRDYPITTNFPHTLTELRATGLNLKRIDGRMLKLGQLTVLDLSDNNISSLPPEIARLTKLRELNLSGNKITRLDANLAGNSNGGAGFCQSLCTLDLSKNQLKFLPGFLSRFKSLVTLRIGGNPIPVLPGSLLTSRLRNLDLQDLPELSTLPSSSSKVYLDTLYVTGKSKFMDGVSASPECRRIIHNSLASVATLEDLATLAVLVRGLRPYVTEESVPMSLIQKLDSAQQCICGGFCPMTSHAAGLSLLDLHKMAASVHADQLLSYNAKVITVYCSQKCLKRFNKNYA